jgi:hypothetical protein
MKDKCKHKKDNKCLLNGEFCQDFYESQKLCNEYKESDCPIHSEGHIFVQCDEWGFTCVCGKNQ